MIEREPDQEPGTAGRASEDVTELRREQPPTAESQDDPGAAPAPRVDTAGIHRLGRGIRWSDIVAMIEQDRLASEAARGKAA